MRLYTRHFFGLFWDRFLAVFLFLQIFLALCNLLAVLPHAPQVPFRSLLLATPDLLLTVLPLSVSLSVIVGCWLFFEAAQKQRAFFWIELAGRNPRRYLAGLALFGLVCSAGLLALNSYVLPKVRFNVDYVLTRPRDNPASLALLLASQRAVSGFQMDFQFLPPGRLADFAVAKNKNGNSLLIAAPEAELNLSADGRYLDLTLQNGRGLRLDSGGRLTDNVAFARLAIRLSANRLFGESKANLLKPRYYTEREFGLLPAIVRYREDRGLLLVKNRQKRNLSSIPAIRVVRLQEALNPCLYFALFLLLVGTYQKDGARTRGLLAAGLCLFALLPQQILFQALADRDRLGWPGLALLPTAEVAAATACGRLWRWLRGMR